MGRALQAKNPIYIPILIAKADFNDRMCDTDRQSIAVAVRIRSRHGGGKSGLHGTAHWLTARRGDPTIRATVTNRFKDRVKRAISVCSNLE